MSTHSFKDLRNPPTGFSDGWFAIATENVVVAIILEPQILFWLLASTSIVVGLMLLAAANFFHKLAADLRTSER